MRAFAVDRQGSKRSPQAKKLEIQRVSAASSLQGGYLPEFLSNDHPRRQRHAPDDCRFKLLKELRDRFDSWFFREQLGDGNGVTVVFVEGLSMTKTPIGSQSSERTSRVMPNKDSNGAQSSWLPARGVRSLFIDPAYARSADVR